ncbi:MAG: helix-turn-helix transcriptional regulator [Candidatus Gastranaerophilales bacterium]|nr:helix-turn-helix transcriptional regulator [Candidatus Gastranaerophilales bacterium]
MKVYVYAENMHEQFYVKLGRRIKERRLELDITQQELADRINKGINFVGKIEVAYSRPSLNTLLDISKALKIDLKDLVNF